MAVRIGVSYGVRQLAISADIARDEVDVVSVNGSITITNQDNIVLTITDDDIDDLTPFTGALSFNGTQYGTLTETAGLLKVTYTDGTFEIF